MITKNNKLKYVHIGDEVWACGKIKYNPKTKKKHMVIYAPNRKQYDVFDEDALSISTELDEYGDIKGGNVNRKGNCAIQEKLKIFILTSILDNRENWCFDLNCNPRTDKLKIIYDNGTVKNIDFTGTFDSVRISKKYSNSDNIRVTYGTKLIHPIAYRICQPNKIINVGEMTSMKVV